MFIDILMQRQYWNFFLRIALITAVGYYDYNLIYDRSCIFQLYNVSDFFLTQFYLAYLFKNINMSTKEKLQQLQRNSLWILDDTVYIVQLLPSLKIRKSIPLMCITNTLLANYLATTTTMQYSTKQIQQLSDNEYICRCTRQNATVYDTWT